MSNFTIPYGKTQLSFHLPDGLNAELLAPAPVPPVPDPRRAVCNALDHPVGDFRWEDFAHARSVAIAISDKTRPVPLSILLPPLLTRLAELGIPDEAITLIIASGAHIPMRPDEFAVVLPREILARYRVLSHDCDDNASLIELGTTTRGTAVWAHREFVRADLRIALGDIEPHQFVGFSGGVKSAAIGLAGRETIRHNHAMMLDPHAYQGRYDDNPVRQDIEEIGKIIGVHCALNSVIGANREIVGVIAGDPVAVMAKGMPLALAVYRVPVAAPFDLMIVSCGGYPKDINVYQAQKALGHASTVLKPGGTIIWVAACPEGSGGKLYEEFVKGIASQEQVLARFHREPFRLGGHKAFMLARDLTRVRVLMVTDLAPDLAQRWLLPRVESLDAALESALANLALPARVGIMPIGNVTMPTTADDR